MTNLELAQLGYSAYGQAVDNKNYQGLPMPEFDQLPDRIAAAWMANAAAIEMAVRKELSTPEPTKAITYTKPAEFSILDLARLGQLIFDDFDTGAPHSSTDEGLTFDDLIAMREALRKSGFEAATLWVPQGYNEDLLASTGLRIFSSPLLRDPANRDRGTFVLIAAEHGLADFEFSDVAVAKNIKIGGELCK